MTDNLWRKERTRLYLLSYNELLYLLNKYPKSTPYKLNKQTKDASTQTSPQLNCNQHIKNINKNSDTSAVSTTFVMTPSAESSKISPASTTSPTVIMSPSPDTKKKQDCDPFIDIPNTPPPKQIPFLQNNNNNNNNNKSMKTVHASALKVSDCLLNSLLQNNSHNDSENDTQHSQNQNKNKNKNKKRSYQQLNELNHTFSQCNINENNRPFKRRKISQKCNKNYKKQSPQDINTQNKQKRKDMLLQYYNMNKSDKNDKTRSDIVQKKAIKPPLIRCNKNPNCFSVISTNFHNNNNIKKQLTFDDNYDSIESTSPTSPPCKQYIKQKKTVKKKKNTPKLSIISRNTSLNPHKNLMKTPHKNKQTRKRSSLLHKTGEHKNVTDDSNFFGLLPELDAQDIKECDALIHNAKNQNQNQIQMSDNEIIRFENKISNISHISPINNNNNEKEWRFHNESVPDHNQSYASNSNSERFVIRKQQHKYTPLWKASMNLPQHEKYFDIKNLSANNDRHPLDKYDDKYLDCNDVSPQTKLAQHSLRSSYNDGDVNGDVTHSQIVEKYHKNVACYGGDNENNMNVYEENSESKISLFENTDFSAEQMKINSLLNQSNDNNENENQNNGIHKYSVFKYPQ